MKNNIICTLLCSVLLFQSHAQIHNKTSYKLSDISLGLGVGITQFHGDIMQKKDNNPAFLFQVLLPLEGDVYYFQTEFVYGILSAENTQTLHLGNIHDGSVLQPINGEYFNMQYLEIDANILFSISTLFNKLMYQRMGSRLKAQKQKLDILLKLGVGLNMYRSVRKELITERFINSYGYDWSWQNEFENGGSKQDKTVNEGVLVIGMIAEYKMSNNWNVNFSATSRIGDTDKWDAKLNSNNDMFMLYSLGTTFRLPFN